MAFHTVSITSFTAFATVSIFSLIASQISMIVSLQFSQMNRNGTVMIWKTADISSPMNKSANFTTFLMPSHTVEIKSLIPLKMFSAVSLTALNPLSTFSLISSIFPTIAVRIFSHISLTCFQSSDSFSLILSQFLYSRIPTAIAAPIAMMIRPIGDVRNVNAAPRAVVAPVATVHTPDQRVVAALMIPSCYGSGNQ